MAAQIIADRYELGDRLGLGGMSTVQIAHDRRLERDVAVKLLAEHLADDPQFVSRFRREALAAARLVHPNIVQVFDFGLDEATDRHYIVMEHIKGRSCAEILRDDGSLALGDALFIINQACRGLEHAHRHGVVHRDVKPGNLLRSDDGVVKLADFGIAKAVDESAQITQAGSVLGTAAYLAPEQAAGEEATPRSDIYSLGVVTYQLVSGRLPYEAQSLTELALKQQNESPPSLDAVEPNVPRGVAQAVSKALEIDPADRFENADQFREALSSGAAGGLLEGDDTAATAFHRGDPTSATRMAPARAATPPQGSRRLQPSPGPARAAAAPAAAAAATPRKRRRGLRTVLLLLALLAILAVAYAALSASSGGVKLRSVQGQDAAETVRDMKELVDENTR